MAGKQRKKQRAKPPADAAPGVDHEDTSPDATPARDFLVVGVGASAGGLEAFTQLLGHLPLDTGMAFVLVQHLDPTHESALTQILSRATSLPVREITDALAVEPNQVFVIPRNAGLTIQRGVLMLQPRPKDRAVNRPIDAFFESLAEDRRESAIGVVLSGTATDGTLGLEAIKAEGGITFAQDDSAKYDSMPRSAAASGVVDFVLSPQNIAAELTRIARHPIVTAGPPGAGDDGLPPDDDHRGESDREEATEHEDDRTALPSGGNAEEADPPLADGHPARRGRQRGTASKSGEEGYKKILLLLRNHSGVDFSLYRSTTIQRRINRRMIVNKQDTLDEYARFLRGNARELDSLYSDVLISVTSFFRNPETYEMLERLVLPELLKQRSDEPVRVWVLGCSTGQESYSIAMAFTEAAERATRTRHLQVFATDLNDKLLDKARQGLYAKSLAEDISPERLRRFFVEEGGGYRISKMLRERVVFARQNLIADPPFSRMDLISCRNLLIYLEPSLQKRAVPTFHYALRPQGYLMLGASESVGQFTDLFEQVDRKHKIFRKKPASTPIFSLPAGRRRAAADTPPPAGPPEAHREAPTGFRGELNAQREADRIAVAQFAPPGVLINDALQVLQFRGATGAYLEPPAGKASFDVLKMAREGLMLPLRAAIHEARRENRPARADNVRVKRNGGTRTIAVQVIPLKNVAERCFLVLFEEPGGPAKSRNEPPGATPEARSLTREQERGRIDELETDLAATREYLQSVQEQGEASNEELQAANEEVQSANEELQSINEELDTSKEELESANEELTTVNEEMSNRNTELNRLNNDLVNIQNSTKLAIVLLGRDLVLRRFSTQAEKQFDLLATDLGKPIGNIRHNLVEFDGDRESPLDMEGLASEVIASVCEQEHEVRDTRGGGRWYSLRVRPYMTLDNRVDGAVLVLIDIDDLKRNEQAISNARDYAQNIVDTARDPMLVLDRDLRVESANRSFYRVFDTSASRTLGWPIYDLGNRQWDIPRLRELLEMILPGRTSVEDYEVEHIFESVGHRVMLLNARRIHDPQRNAERILLVIDDITERAEADEALAHQKRLYEGILNTTPDLACIFDLDHRFLYANDALLRMWGKSREQAIGKNCLELGYEPWHAEMHGREIETVVSTGALIRGQVPFTGTLGQRIYDYIFTPVLDTRGRVVAVAGTTRDVTQDKENEENLRRSEVRYRRLFQAAQDGVLILDAQTGAITDANAFIGGLVGLDPDELLGKELHDIGLFSDAVESKQAFHELRENGYIRYEDLPLRNRQGDAVQVEVIGNLYREDGRLVAQCNVRDISRRVAMEVRIREQAEEMAAELRRKDEFLAMLSHELRNPLAPIRSAAHLLRAQGKRDGEDAIRQQACRVIERQVGNLTKLVNDLLEVSRVISGRVRLNLQPLNLSEVLRHAVETTRPMFDQHGQTLSVHFCDEPPVWVDADPTRIEEVFVNILHNAAKYTPDGGRVEVHCEHLADRDRAEVRVQDDGVGIEPRLLGNIFDLFTQADRSLDRAGGGLGIGLSLARRLVELHGGTIEAASPPPDAERGSVFTVTLPIASESLQNQRPEPEDPPARPGVLRILLVDDNIDLTAMLAGGLRLEGHSVRTASTGPDGLAAALDWRPDVVLLDIGLPGLDGYEVARRLRADRTLRSEGVTIRLIAITGYGRESDVTLAREAGFDAHLTKPVDFEHLERVLAAPPGPEEG